MELSPEIIKRALEGNLGGAASHRRLVPPNRELTVRSPEVKKDLKKSSVLLLLFMQNDDLTACLLKRPAHMKHHASQIALPGGRIEPGETALETALRETWEEIGIYPEAIRILGPLSELYVGVSGFLIHPFVGWLKKKPRFRINPSEVEKTVLFPLLKHKRIYHQTVRTENPEKFRVPSFRFHEEIIWGATAMILAEFYDAMEAVFTEGSHSDNVHSSG